MTKILPTPWSISASLTLETLHRQAGLMVCYAFFRGERTPAAIRGKLQRLGLVAKRTAAPRPTVAELA